MSKTPKDTVSVEFLPSARRRFVRWNGERCEVVRVVGKSAGALKTAKRIYVHDNDVAEAKSDNDNVYVVYAPKEYFKSDRFEKALEKTQYLVKCPHSVSFGAGTVFDIAGTHAGPDIQRSVNLARFVGETSAASARMSDKRRVAADYLKAAKHVVKVIGNVGSVVKSFPASGVRSGDG